MGEHGRTIYVEYTGWWKNIPSEKYESQLGLLFPTAWKNKMFQTTNQYMDFETNL